MTQRWNGWSESTGRISKLKLKISLKQRLEGKFWRVPMSSYCPVCHENFPPSALPSCAQFFYLWSSPLVIFTSPTLVQSQSLFFSFFTNFSLTLTINVFYRTITPYLSVITLVVPFLVMSSSPFLILIFRCLTFLLSTVWMTWQWELHCLCVEGLTGVWRS